MDDKIFYDGQCEFCLKMTTFLELNRSFSLINIHDPVENPKNKYPVNKQELEEKIHLINHEGKIYVGGEALIEILAKRNYINPKLASISRTQLVKKIFNTTYWVISKNRSFFNLLFDFCVHSNRFRINRLHSLWLLSVISLNGLYLINQNKPLTSFFAVLFFYLTLYSSYKYGQLKLSPVGALIGNIVYTLISIFLMTELASKFSALSIAILINLRLQFKLHFPLLFRYLLSIFVFLIIFLFAHDKFLLYQPILMSFIFHLPLKPTECKKNHSLILPNLFNPNVFILKCTLSIGIGMFLLSQY